jgi:nucleoside-diphosphate-sugar epimerase
MRVLVTGGSGRLGQAVTADLLANGYEVVSIDRRLPPDRERSIRHIAGELDDVGQVAGALAGCDGVIHLGAIPHPYGHADEVVFRNNSLATFSVLQAASLLGIGRAVIASSISALGTAYAREQVLPLYAPVEEAHPLLSADPYALSKEVDERTAAMFNRRTGMNVAALRFAWIARLEDVVAGAARHRENREANVRILWSYVEIRDAARACRLALEASDLGFEAFNVTAADTISDLETEELLGRYAPGVDIRERIEGTSSAWSIEKARRLLRFEPEYTWRGAESRLDEEVVSTEVPG